MKVMVFMLECYNPVFSVTDFRLYMHNNYYWILNGK